MQFQQTTDLNIDRNGLESVVYIDPRFPITVFRDEMDKYINGYIRWHWHPQLEFVLAESEIEIGYSDEQFHLSPGDGAFINAGQLHMFRGIDSSEGTSAYAVLFAPEMIASADSIIYDKYLRPIIDNAKLPIVILRKGDDSHAPLLEKLRECIELYQKDDIGCELALRNCLSSLWLDLIGNMAQYPLRHSSKQNRQSQFRLKQMLSFIRQNYAQRISLEDIANAALVSKSECLRCFRSRFDMTPIQYLIQCRLELACHLLRSTELSVKEIASRCGFDDAGYFGRIFRKRCGLTPASYRAEAAQKS